MPSLVAMYTQQLEGEINSSNAVVQGILVALHALQWEDRLV